METNKSVNTVETEPNNIRMVRDLLSAVNEAAAKATEKELEKQLDTLRREAYELGIKEGRVKGLLEAEAANLTSSERSQAKAWREIFAACRALGLDGLKEPYLRLSGKESVLLFIETLYNKAKRYDEIKKNMLS